MSAPPDGVPLAAEKASQPENDQTTAGLSDHVAAHTPASGTGRSPRFASGDSHGKGNFSPLLRSATVAIDDLHLPEPLRDGPGGVPEVERPPTARPLPALVRNGGALELAVRIVELDRHVVPRGIDIRETRLRGDGGERQVPLHRASRARDDEYLHLHGRGLRAARG